MERKCLAFTALFVHAACLDAEERATLRVLVFDRAQIPPIFLLAAQHQAARVLHAAGIRTSWKVCTPASLKPGATPCAPADALTVQIRVLRGKELRLWPVNRDACGIGVTSEPGTFGFLAIVDADCVDRIARQTADAGAAVLGHVVAHEIGHLLLGRNSHGPSGLMSARWTAREQRSILRGDLHLSAEDAALLQSAMDSRAAAAKAHSAF